MKEEDFTRILELEEQYVQKICDDLIRIKPDVVFTEKGVSDLAQHYLVKVIRNYCFNCVLEEWFVFKEKCFLSISFHRLALLQCAACESLTTIALLALLVPPSSIARMNCARKMLEPKLDSLKLRK